VRFEISILEAGLDPEIGFLHSNPKGRLSLVYDLMEPLRPVVDLAILNLVKEHTFTPDDFMLSSRGVCRMHPQMVRKFVELLPKAERARGLALALAARLTTLPSRIGRPPD
jgi:CRISPR/Cas system-associated endonuclease Cas1